MKKQVFWYGLGLAMLIVLLKYFEYSFFVKSFSQEVYLFGIALIFTILGIWGGIKWIDRRNQVNLATSSQNSKEVQKKLDISEREMDVLLGIAEGLSNQQIADKLFLSESTIKTHGSNLFSKLSVNRRTQAVQKARELGLLQ